MSSAQILLVEDEKIVARDVQNRLQSMGYTVSGVASTGEEALQKASESFPDLVLMDIMLKGNMDGVEASEQLRRLYHIPVVYLTAYADDHTLQRAKVTEPYGYLLKPYEERELYTTIEIALFKHRTERKLRETEQWLAATLASIGDAVTATDSQGSIRLLNPRAEALTGWKASQASGRNLIEVLKLVDEQARELVPNPITRALHSGASVALPAHSVLVSRDKRLVPIEGTVAPIHDSDGNLAGLVLVVRDISLRLRHEETQRRLDEQLHQARKMESIGRLAAGVAHDFNNLLTVVLGNTSMVMASDIATGPNRTCLEAVEQAGLRAADLVRKLQSFARRSELRLEAIDLNERLRKSIDALRPTLEPSVTIHLDLADNLWPVQADAAQMHQVVLNLALNAREAMPEGGMLNIATANVTLKPDADNVRSRSGDFVCVRVADSGLGMAADVRAHLFEPFTSTKGPSECTGLGLAMVYGIVEQQNGWIECHDADPGTRFDVYLPRYGQGYDTPPRQAHPALNDVPQHPAARSQPERQPTLLLADDEPMVRELARKILESEGYRVLLAEDGMQAVEVFQRASEPIDLVVLDMKMPRLSGPDAFAIMLALDGSIHALFLSGFFAADTPIADNPHVVGFVPKPFRISELLASIRQALDKLKPVTV